jgi:hypothetical protein
MIKIIFTMIAVALLAACSDADIVSKNITKAADNFEVNRRIVFYNGITGEYILTVEGLCSLGSAERTNSLTVTCKTGPSAYKKHFLGLSNNVTFFAEQVQAFSANPYAYRVVFKPAAIIPDVEIRR